MSYARFGDECDVYVYRSYGSKIKKEILVCCSCRLTPKDQEMIGGSTWYRDFVVESREEMVDHLLVHREAGHKIPQRTLNRLTQEIIS